MRLLEWVLLGVLATGIVGCGTPRLGPPPATETPAVVTPSQSPAAPIREVAPPCPEADEDCSDGHCDAPPKRLEAPPEPMTFTAPEEVSEPNYVQVFGPGKGLVPLAIDPARPASPGVDWGISEACWFLAGVVCATLVAYLLCKSKDLTLVETTA